jgi:Asp/Glu/hydantoin racemase
MKQRVLVVVPFAMSAENLALRQEQLEGIALSPQLQFEFRPVKAGPLNYSSHHDFVLADAANFEAGCRAQDEGFAAVCIDTMSDSGVAALRSVLDIPVFGPGKSSMLAALMLGEAPPMDPSPFSAQRFGPAWFS